MTEISSYVPGTPSWVDVGVPDIDAGVKFYGDLFGWSIPESANSEQTGGYRQAMLRDKPVAGMMPLMAEGQPSAWTNYVSVEDAAATAAKVTENGGSVMAEPMDVLDLGKMAIFADPEGAVFGVWQAGTFIGAGLVNEPVSLSWNEINTRDPGKGKEFYSAVFGWTGEDADMGDGVHYTIWKRADGEMVAGMNDITGRAPDEVPAHWLAYFAVDDTDATIAKAKELGGTVMLEPIDIPAGRMAILTDPAGAHFGVIALAPTD